MNAERLLKLAEHLESGKLAHEKFDYNTYSYSRDENDPDPREKFGSCGCAIGELPEVFPETWTWENLGLKIHKNEEILFFELSYNDYNLLFMDLHNLLGLEVENITALHVAKAIRYYVKHETMEGFTL